MLYCTVHLDQELIQGGISFLVPATRPFFADCVYLINEDNGGRLSLCLLEEVPDSTGAHSHVHLHKFGAREVKKGYSRLSGAGFGQ